MWLQFFEICKKDENSKNEERLNYHFDYESEIKKN